MSSIDRSRSSPSTLHSQRSLNTQRKSVSSSTPKVAGGSRKQREDEEPIFPIANGKFQKRVLFILSDIRRQLTTPGRLSTSGVGSTGVEEIEQAEIIDDFNDLEDKCKDPEERKKMVQMLSLTGGVNVKDNVKKIMEKLMSNDLMSKFNMKDGKQKISFKSSAVYRLVQASAMRTTSGTTEHEIVTAISSCLKYAPDRRGGAGRKK